jgi:hypothetical protein
MEGLRSSPADPVVLHAVQIGFGTYSTGPHLCVETEDTWLNTFPKGTDPCH